MARPCEEPVTFRKVTSWGITVRVAGSPLHYDPLRLRDHSLCHGCGRGHVADHGQLPRARSGRVGDADRHTDGPVLGGGLHADSAGDRSAGGTLRSEEHDASRRSCIRRWHRCLWVRSGAVASASRGAPGRSGIGHLLAVAADLPEGRGQRRDPRTLRHLQRKLDMRHSDGCRGIGPCLRPDRSTRSLLGGGSDRCRSLRLHGGARATQQWSARSGRI